MFVDVPVAGRTAEHAGQYGLQAKPETAIVVGSSCGIRKAGGSLNDVIHVAPVKRLTSVAPGWGEPWEGRLNVLPLPGLQIEGQVGPFAANLARLSLCGADTLRADRRIASVSIAGMAAVKGRVATYFSRVPLPVSVFEEGAFEEWHELDLWETWTRETGSAEGFQAWLDEVNPNFEQRRRRDTIYDDLGGVQGQLEIRLQATQ